MSSAVYEGPVINHAPPPKSAAVLHPKAIAHPKQVTEGIPIVVIRQDPTGRGSPTNRTVAALPIPPLPRPDSGCKGCGSKPTTTGKTPVGFTKSPDGGSVPTDSRPGGAGSTPVQIRPQALGRVGLRANVEDAGTPAQVADVVDPAVLQPGNVQPDLPSSDGTNLSAFFVKGGQTQWWHVALAIVGVIVVYKVVLE